MNLLFGYILFIVLILASWNAYIILWGTAKNLPELYNKRKRWSKIWHKTGWVIRFMIACLILWLMIGNIEFIFSWKLFAIWLLAFINVSWILYDLTINVIRKLEANQCSVTYIDNKGFNGFCLKYLGFYYTWIFRGVLVLINLIILI